MIVEDNDVTQVLLQQGVIFTHQPSPLNLMILMLVIHRESIMVVLSSLLVCWDATCVDLLHELSAIASAGAPVVWLF